MRSVGLILAAAVVSGGTAQASTVLLSDNFDSENGGSAGLNYGGFSNWNVTTGGNVDVVFSGDVYGLECVSGGCVDAADQILRVTFSVSGSQRGTDAAFYAGFVPSDALDVVAYGYNLGTGDVTFSGPFSPIIFSQLVAGADPWTTQSVFIITGSAGTANVAFGGGGLGNTSVGPLLDNVEVTIGAVPEPTTWAMMIAGFAFVGASLRRRKISAAFA
jgi:hypothetical protein